MLSGVSPTLQTGLCYAGECIDTLMNMIIQFRWSTMLSLHTFFFVYQVTELPPDEENISQLMGYLTGLQGMHSTSTSPIK